MSDLFAAPADQLTREAQELGAEPHAVIISGLRAKVAELEADQPKGKDNRVREVLQSVHLYLSKPVETRGDGKSLLDSVAAAAKHCGAPDSITTPQQREFKQ